MPVDLTRSRAVTLLLAGVVGAVFVAGLAVHGALGGALLVLVAGALVVLTLSAWGRVRRAGRPGRLIIIAVVLAVAIAKFAGAA